MNWVFQITAKVLFTMLPEYHHWTQDDFCDIFPEVQKHCGSQNLQTEEHYEILENIKARKNHLNFNCHPQDVWKVQLTTDLYEDFLPVVLLNCRHKFLQKLGVFLHRETNATKTIRMTALATAKFSIIYAIREEDENLKTCPVALLCLSPI